ncbi:hypothetical protein HmCmsJML222_01051 [Escherichia coli]|uniref:hypothetical protein n=1 Tax=Enterobacteriaceae TaxID=543 RepID=UPI0010D4F556|nr:MULTISPECIES: hypothetical protein [Enterobacteriaceae]GDC15487.1 hypothetical protein HmCmsJML222_01051 [Escherichia coli]
MKILRQLWNQKGLDAAVEDVPEDRYGFGNIAENMALLQIVGGDKLIIPFC